MLGFGVWPPVVPTHWTSVISHWILEGVRHSQYRVIARCSPPESDPIRIIGVRAMRLANLKVYGDQIY
jgi:hypothetical protein